MGQSVSARGAGCASFFYPSPSVPVFAPPHQTMCPQEVRGDVATSDLVPFYWGPPRRQGLCSNGTIMHTVKPTGMAVSHCITWFQTQLILTMCHIQYHGHLWDHRSTGQL